MDVLPAEEIRIDGVALGVAAHPGEGRVHGLLHHLAEVAGHGELLSAAHAAGFDEDDIAARRRPYQADRNAGALDALLDLLFGAELGYTEQLAHNLRGDQEFVGLPLGQAPGLLAGERGNLALEVAHTGFARIAVDDLPQAVLGKLEQLANPDAMLIGLFGDQVLRRDVDLLFLGVARQFYDLHAIA